MNNGTSNIIIGIILIVGIGGTVLAEKHELLEESQPATILPDATVADTADSITVAEVATHNSISDCWAIINGNVYDLTSWIPNHPGGPQAILQLCGTDGSAKFNDQHGGSSKVLSVLAGFKIGIVAQ